MDRVAVVGRDLEPVEQITGRMNYGWTALRGGGTGALSGALIGWNNIGLLTWPHPVLAVLMRTPYGLTFGAILGGLIALAMGASQPGLRERNAGRPLQPRHFDIVADVEGAECVLQLLGESGSMGISHDNGAGIDLATTNSVITAWQGATSCSPRHNFTELPRTRSGRPAVELHYPRMIERLRAETRIGKHSETGADSPLREMCWPERAVHSQRGEIRNDGEFHYDGCRYPCSQ
jgi:hypothetical protein